MRGKVKNGTALLTNAACLPEMRDGSSGGGVAYFGGGQFLTNVTTSHPYTYYYFALNFKDNGKH
jgi:hypothetical protein